MDIEVGKPYSSGLFALYSPRPVYQNKLDALTTEDREVTEEKKRVVSLCPPCSIAFLDSQLHPKFGPQRDYRE